MAKNEKRPKANIFCGFVDFLFKVLALLFHLSILDIFFSLSLSLPSTIQHQTVFQWQKCIRFGVYSLYSMNANLNMNGECLVVRPYGSKYYSLFCLIHVFRPNFGIRFINLTSFKRLLSHTRGFFFYSHFTFFIFLFAMIYELWILSLAWSRKKGTRTKTVLML